VTQIAPSIVDFLPFRLSAVIVFVRSLPGVPLAPEGKSKRKSCQLAVDGQIFNFRSCFRCYLREMRILIVEDNLVLADKIAAALRQTDHAVDMVHDGEDALNLVLQETFDLLILDLSLPGLDGIEILKTVRARQINLPVMILTARGNLDERVAGLDAGADDYMVKPFELSELEARARALLRRNIGKRNPYITVGKLSFNSVDRSVTIDGQPVSLTPRERGVLEILLLNISQVISKEKIALHLFGFDDEASVKSIELYISRLRKKIASGDVEVRTIRGLGYMIDE